VVVGEDRLLDARGLAVARAVGAQHPGGGEDGVRGVIGAERLAGVGVDGELAEGAGQELHRALGSGEVRAGVNAGEGRPAVVAFDLADARQDRPGQAGAGLRGADVPGQVVRGDISPGQGDRLSGKVTAGCLNRRVLAGGGEQDDQQRKSGDDCRCGGGGLDHRRPSELAASKTANWFRVFPSADGEVATGLAAYTKACCFPGQR